MTAPDIPAQVEPVKLTDDEIALRDKIAIAALPICVQLSVTAVDRRRIKGYEAVALAAQSAYEHADAMLAARKK